MRKLQFFFKLREYKTIHKMNVTGSKTGGKLASKRSEGDVAIETFRDWFGSDTSGDATMRELKRVRNELGVDRTRIEGIDSSNESKR